CQVARARIGVRDRVLERIPWGKRRGVIDIRDLSIEFEEVGRCTDPDQARRLVVPCELREGWVDSDLDDVSAPSAIGPGHGHHGESAGGGTRWEVHRGLADREAVERTVDGEDIVDGNRNIVNWSSPDIINEG